MNMQKFAFFLIALVAIFLLAGCGGNGVDKQVSDGRSHALDGNWNGYAFQMHDDGSTTSIELTNFNIVQGLANADFVVYDNPPGTSIRTEIDRGHLRGSVNPNIAPWIGLELMVDGRGGGGGTWFSTNNLKIKDEVVSVASVSNINERRYPTRYDWEFYMSPSNRGEFKSPTTSTEFIASMKQRH